MYTGYTNDLKVREKTHNLGKGAIYTRIRGPVKIIYYEEFKTRLEAMRREREVKSWSRAKKQALIKKK